MESPSYKEYSEGVDYSVSREINKYGNILFFFYNLNGELIGYIRTHYEELRDGQWSLKRAKIIDTVSGYKLDQNAPEMLELFKEKGYKGFGLPDFGVTMYSEVLRYFQEKNGDNISIDVDAYEENKKIIWNLVKKVKERTEGLVKSYRGGDDGNVAKIYLCPKKIN